ncbi:hypothetical protein O0L34_g10024 [Tuta absoluta]|nr:hypothetical protein O0L34_g10024 [Tuta absoluta]
MNMLYIFFNFRTGIVDESGKNVNLNRKYIARHYCKDTLVLDILSAAPFQFIPMGRKFQWNCRFPTFTVFYVFKFFRIIICGRVWNNLAKQFNVSYLWAKTVITIVHCAIFFHWMVYVHFQVPVFLAHYYPHLGRFHEWILRFKVYTIV